MDGLIGRYHIRIKTRKWTNRVFFHIMDTAMVNAYVLFHRLHKGDKGIQLPKFRTEVAESLCAVGTNSEKRQAGRPMTTPQPKPKKCYIPPDDVRYDNIGHWCIFTDRTGKKICKLPGCKSEAQSYCTKCKLNLCNSTSKSCFIKFHVRN